MSKITFEKILKSRGFKNIGDLDHVILSKNILKRSGDIRKHLFSFYDQNYCQWSLRPDLYISAALKFLKENTKEKRKYWYSGVAYRKSYNKFNNVIDTQEIAQLILKIIGKKHNIRETFNLSATKPIKMIKIMNIIKSKYQSKSKIKKFNNSKNYFLISTDKIKKKLGFHPQSTEKIILRNL